MQLASDNNLLIAEEDAEQAAEKCGAELETAIEDGTLSADEWSKLSLAVGEPIFGSEDNCIVRPLTKNIILAPEKSFKTTFGLRLMMGLSCGEAVFPQLPVPAPRSVLYVHGELSPPEIVERTCQAIEWLDGANLYQACNHRVNLYNPQGQHVLREILDHHRELGRSPEVLILDPWQSFIAGCDENSFKEVSEATKFLENLIHEYRLTVFIVMHTGKDRFKGARGHSLLAGWRDSIFELESNGGRLTVTVKPRWAPPVPPFSLRFKDGTLWPTDSSPIHFTPQELQIRQHLQEKGGHSTKSEVGKVLGLGKGSLQKALSRASKNDAISIDGDVVRLPQARRTGEGRDAHGA